MPKYDKRLEAIETAAQRYRLDVHHGAILVIVNVGESIEEAEARQYPGGIPPHTGPTLFICATPTVRRDH